MMKMLKARKLGEPVIVRRRVGIGAVIALAMAGAWSFGLAQQIKLVSDASKPTKTYLPIPGFDTTSLDPSVDPCNDFYKFACGKFAANHPIPADQAGVDQFYALFNVNTQSLYKILTKAAEGGAGRSPDEQKIGDYYKACMDTDAIEAKGIAPVEPLLNEIDAVKSKDELPALMGKLQRIGVNVFFGYGEQQDFKDARKQIAFIQQGGLGLPEKDYYLRTGAKDVELREQYVAHIAKMLELAGPRDFGFRDFAG
jgi:putative endopeptidase